MHASEELRYDHEVLRGKLMLLEERAPSVRECPCTFSRLTDSLATCLRSHTEREERLLAMSALRQGEPQRVRLQHLHDEHENHRTRLAILHDLLSQPESASEEQIIAQASDLANDLREHMAREERQVFPLLDGDCGGEAWTAVGEETVEMLGLA